MELREILETFDKSKALCIYSDEYNEVGLFTGINGDDVEFDGNNGKVICNFNRIRLATKEETNVYLMALINEVMEDMDRAANAKMPDNPFNTDVIIDE